MEDLPWDTCILEHLLLEKEQVMREIEFIQQQAEDHMKYDESYMNYLIQ